MIDSALAREFMETGRSESCPVIDVHTHYGPFRAIYFPVSGGEKLLRAMDRCGCRLILSAHHTALFDMQRGHDEMAREMRRLNGRVCGYVCYNPCYPELARRELGRIDSDPGFVGIKCLSSYHKVPLDDPRYEPAFEFANERGLPALLHTWGGDRYCGPDFWPALAEKYPNVTFFMGHSGFGQWDDAFAHARTYPNVYLELCAAFTVRGMIERAVAACGPGKLLFGTDFPWFDFHYGLGCVLFADISDEDRRRILYRNAARVLSERGILRAGGGVGV
jgi:predicted TIM-barrel fold metal-dependent hydrolase